MDPSSQAPRPSQPAVPNLIEDFRKQQEAWNHQALELARLRAEVLAAAEREAADLVKTTRSRIALLLGDARRELLGLAAQIEAIPDTPDGSAAAASAAARDHVLEARRELQRVLDEVAPELERVSNDAQALAARRQPARHELIPGAIPPADNSNGSVAPIDWPVETTHVAAVGAREPLRVTHEAPWWRRASGVAALLTGAVVVSGALWVLRGSLPSVRRPTQAAIAVMPTPPASTAPQPSSSSAAAKPPDQTVPAQPARRFPVTVLIETNRPAWIRTTIDGKSDTGRVFAAGEKKTVVADREIVLRVGDAGAVFVTVNGAAREPFGPRGIVATRRFAANPSPAPASPLPAAPPRVKPSVDDAPPPTAPASDAGATLTTAGERWLDAYYRRDVSGLASVATRDMKITDERSADERLPAGLPNVRRALDGVTFQFAGNSAILTARMIETSTASADAMQRVAWISQMWIREDSQWRLMDVHILGDMQRRQPDLRR